MVDRTVGVAVDGGTVDDPELDRLLGQEVQRLTASLDRPLDVLEAGCGRQWTIDLADRALHLTGIDLDREALAHRANVVGDLDSAILGDLRDAALVAPATFDLIYSACVLEHIPGAQTALDNFLQWLRPQGILIIRIPDQDTVFGFLGGHLPHAFHLAYEKLVLGNSQAGRPGHGPYRTTYGPEIGLRGMRNYCAKRQLIVERVYRTNFGEQPWTRGPRFSATNVKWTAMRIAMHVGGLLSFGRLDATYSDVILVLRRSL